MFEFPPCNVSSGVFFCIALLWSFQSGYSLTLSLDGLRRSAVSKSTIARSHDISSYSDVWQEQQLNLLIMSSCFMGLFSHMIGRLDSILQNSKAITFKHNKCQKIYIMTSKDNNSTPIHIINIVSKWSTERNSQCRSEYLNSSSDFIWQTTLILYSSSLQLADLHCHCCVLKLV